MKLVTRTLRRLEKLRAVLQQICAELHGRPLAQRGQQSLFRPWIPKPIQRIPELSTGHAQPNMPRRNMLYRVRLVEDHEIVLEQNPFVIRLTHAAKQREE